MAEPAVLDSSAVLAVFLNEPGGEIVIPILEGALLSTVNLAEVHTRMLDRGAEAAHAWSRVQSVQCEICFFTEQQARIAAELLPVTRAFGLSLGERACLALAIDRNATVYTTDRIWKNLGLGINVEVIR
ncbi:MAG TPA: type II toxin-antitoxin system VapC family toxin [Terracidiphilus sp.]|nr:type II toxin-antitoxin system VapC family toxin [Terracidiphilus sp.]